MPDAGFSWNLVTDLQDLWSFPLMVNAFQAGTIVAVLAGVLGGVGGGGEYRDSVAVLKRQPHPEVPQ
ncbi:MAG: transporter [Actinomycetia bacterium]|nr:transporter [Actinomycetes bacterium]